MKKKCILLVVIIFMINTLYSNFEVKCLENFSLTSQSNVKYACSIKNAYIQDNLGNEVLKVDTGDMLIINKKLNKKSIVIEKKTGITGYIENTYINTIDDANTKELKSFNSIGTITNVDTFVNIRKYPSINSVSIDWLNNETKVNILGKIGKWYKVKFHNKLGYIFEEFISIKK